MHSLTKKVSAFATIIAFTALLFACKNDKTSTSTDPAKAPEHADLNYLAGHWVAMDFCARANQYGSVLAAMNNAHKPYTYSITFDMLNKDSVVCFNGIETWKVKARINIDTIELLNARAGQSVFLVYDPTGRDMTMFDPTSGSTETDKFSKSKAGAATGALSFQVALNHNLFQGTFTNSRKTSQNNITFSPGGILMNFPDFDRYKTCIGGDCFRAGDAADIITFSKAKVPDSEKTFGFRYSRQNDTLYVYNLIPVGAEGKGAKTGSLAYEFARKIPPAFTPPPAGKQTPGTTAPAGK